MRVIPPAVEAQLEKLELTFHERQALYINAQGGGSPPDWICDHIANRIGSHALIKAWAVIKGDNVLLEIAQSNLRGSSMDNLPTPLLANPA